MQQRLDMGTARSVRFAVSGQPISQGSKSAYVVQGRAVLVELADKPKANRPAGGLKRWRAHVGWQARIAMQQAKLARFEGPVHLDVEFVLPRPPSHYTKASGRLTKSAPDHPALPDLSKLVRAVEDAMSGIVYGDDRQIVTLNASKRYARKGGTGGALIHVGELQC